MPGLDWLLMYCCRFFFRTHLGFSDCCCWKMAERRNIRGRNFDLELVQVFLFILLAPLPGHPWLADTIMTSLNYRPTSPTQAASREVRAGHDCSTEKELMANLLNGVFKLVWRQSDWHCRPSWSPKGRPAGPSAVLHFQQGPCLVKPLCNQLGLWWVTGSWCCLKVNSLHFLQSPRARHLRLLRFACRLRTGERVRLGNLHSSS